MAAAGSLKGVGVPVKLLHESEGHVVTVSVDDQHQSELPLLCTLSQTVPNAYRDIPMQVELKSGEMYRGELHEAEDNWNVQLSDVTATGRDGKVTHMEHIFIRGSRVRFVIVPDMLKNAPMFKRIDPKNKMKNVALGVGGRGRGAAPPRPGR